MSKVKRQHYVPRFLLENFADEKGMLSVFGRGRGLRFRANPEGVANQKYYYAQRTNGGETDTQRLRKSRAVSKPPDRLQCEGYYRVPSQPQTNAPLSPFYNNAGFSVTEAAAGIRRYAVGY